MTDGLTGSTSETHTLGGVAAIQANRAARREMRVGLREKLRAERARLRRLPAAPPPEDALAVEATAPPPPETAALPDTPTPAEAHPPIEVEATVFGQLITEAVPPEAEAAPPMAGSPEIEPLEDEPTGPEPEPFSETPVEAVAAALPPDEEEEVGAPVVASAITAEATPDLSPCEDPPVAKAMAEEARDDAQPAAPPALPLPGMGPGMVLRLRHLGIESTAQMAEADPAALRRALGPISRLVNVEGWIAAAREIA